jgi:hypothetical protein
MQATELLVGLDGGRIVLSGDLFGGPEQVNLLINIFHAAANLRRDWLVDADEVRLTPEGVSAWIKAIDELSDKCEIIYRPSHLAKVLQYDPRYHRPSTFEDDDDGPDSDAGPSQRGLEFSS